MLKKGRLNSYSFYCGVRVCLSEFAARLAMKTNKKTKGILHIYHVLIFQPIGYCILSVFMAGEFVPRFYTRIQYCNGKAEVLSASSASP
jgi:hypothetical protein